MNDFYWILHKNGFDIGYITDISDTHTQLTLLFSNQNQRVQNIYIDAIETISKKDKIEFYKVVKQVIDIDCFILYKDNKPSRMVNINDDNYIDYYISKKLISEHNLLEFLDNYKVINL